jgi:hypothetical protein
MFPATTRRVAEQTADSINESIRRQTDENIARYAAGGPAAISRRLAELDGEWDIERALEANAAMITLIGVVLGTSVDRRWFILPGIVGAFLLQHALQGWCPPLPVLRRLGIRTSTEIDYERYALKALRGDFKQLDTAPGSNSGLVEKTMQAIRS